MQILRHNRPIRLHIRHILPIPPEHVKHDARKLRPALDPRRVRALLEGRTADALAWRRDRAARGDGPAELVQPRAEHVERGVGREVDGELGESHSVCNPGCARGAVHDEADQTAVISKGSGVCVGAVQLGEREWKGTHAGDESEGALGGARRVLSLSSSAGLLVAQGVSNL